MLLWKGNPVWIMNVSHLFNVRVSDVHLNFEEVLLIGQQLGQHELRLLVLVQREKAVLRRDRRRRPLLGIRMASEKDEEWFWLLWKCKINRQSYQTILMRGNNYYINLRSHSVSWSELHVPVMSMINMKPVEDSVSKVTIVRLSKRLT